MGETVSMDDFRRERRKRDFQEKLYQTAHKAADFIAENKELIAAGIMAGGTILKTAYKLSRGQRLREERRERDRRFYDRRNGCWIETRRKLSSDELCELDWRRRHGESITSALRNMKLMK